MTFFPLTVPCAVCNLDFLIFAIRIQRTIDLILINASYPVIRLPLYFRFTKTHLVPGTTRCPFGLTATASKAPSCTAPLTKSSTSVWRIVIPILHSLCPYARISITSLTSAISATSASDFRTVRLFPIRILITPNG